MGKSASKKRTAGSRNFGESAVLLLLVLLLLDLNANEIQLQNNIPGEVALSDGGGALYSDFSVTICQA